MMPFRKRVEPFFETGRGRRAVERKPAHGSRLVANPLHHALINAVKRSGGPPLGRNPTGGFEGAFNLLPAAKENDVCKIGSASVALFRLQGGQAAKRLPDAGHLVSREARAGVVREFGRS